MKISTWKSIVWNIHILLFGLLVFLWIFGDKVALPAALQVMGRTHPMVLHFPIVLVVILAVWELFIGRRMKEDPVREWLILLASFTATLSALFGFFLSREEGYESGTVLWHQQTGMALAVLLFLWYALRQIVHRNTLVRWCFSLGSVILLLVVGHMGAEITHGEGFVTQPLKQSDAPAPVLADNAEIYTTYIVPILKEKCMNCHNDSKKKGELSMASFEQFSRGGENGTPWDLKDRELGLMMHLINLPQDDDKHMPPKGKPQLTAEEIMLLRAWIRSGSPNQKLFADLAGTDSLRMALTNSYGNRAAAPELPDVSDDKIGKLTTTSRRVQRLNSSSNMLKVSFFNAAAFSMKDVEELGSIKENIVDLSLYRMPVTDADLDVLAKFRALQKLNLGNTRITGKGLKKLAGLDQLNSLVLSGNKLDKSALALLKSLKALKKVYLWNTPLNIEQLDAFRKGARGLEVVTGYSGDTVLAQLSPPEIKRSKFIFADTAMVNLQTRLGGVTIRYTLDGTEPDSLRSATYSKPFILKNSAIVKARSFLKGWQSSPVSVYPFIKANVAIKNTVLLTQPDQQYSGNGVQTVFDGISGSTDYEGEKVLGYKNSAMEIKIVLAKTQRISAVDVHSLLSTGDYIFAPAGIRVELLNRKTGKRVSHTYRSPATYFARDQPLSNEKFTVPIPAAEADEVLIVVQPLPEIPNWHPGKGERGWVFVDEVRIR